MFVDHQKTGQSTSNDVDFYAPSGRKMRGRVQLLFSELPRAAPSLRTWREPEPWLGLSLGLALIPTTLFILSALLLLTGASLDILWSRLILMAAFSCGVWSARKISGTWAIVVPMCLCAIGALSLAHALVDTSYDGQEYHFSAVYALSHGWNPVRLPFPSAPWGPGEKTLWSEANWVNHYPQSSWLSSAVLMAAGFDQEASKCATSLLAAAMFFALVSYGLRLKLAPWKILLFSSAFAANPVIIAQLGTRMNDGILAACFGLTAVYTLSWIQTRQRLCAVGTCATLVFGVNLKFSAVPAFAFLCASLTFALWLCGQKLEAKRFAALAISAAFIGVFVLGFHPYLTNTIHFHHPFYPIMGPHAIDIISEERPNGFGGMPPWLRVVMSYFSRSGSGYHSSAVLKMPFSLSDLELNSLAVPDARLGGFGPLFSGALVLTLVLAAAIALLEHNNGSALTVLGAAGGVLAIAIAMPEGWWARFVPYVWWIPGLAALGGLYCNRRALSALGVVIVLILLMNSALSAYFTFQPLRWKSEEIRSQIAGMLQAKKPLRIFYGNSPARIALIAESGATIIPSSSPLPPSCRPKIIVYAYPMDATGPRPSYCIASPSLSQKPAATRSGGA